MGGFFIPKIMKDEQLQKPNTNSEINVDEEENVNHFNNILNWKDTSKMAWGILNI